MSYKTKRSAEPELTLTMDVDGHKITKTARAWARSEHCLLRNISKFMLAQRKLNLGWSDWQCLNVPRFGNKMSGAAKNAIRERYGLPGLKKTKTTRIPRETRKALKGKALDEAILAWAIDWKEWIV